MTRKLITAAVSLGLLVGCSTDAGRGAKGPVTASPVSASPSAQEALPSPENSDAPKLNQPFRTGSFEVTVTSVKLGVKLIDVDATAKSGGVQGHKPENGQFIQIFLKAKNVGNKPATMSTTDSTLIDDKGREFASAGLLLGGVVGQGLGDTQQPDTTKAGWLAFDVPPTVTGASYVNVQSDPAIDTQNLPVPVELT